MFPKKKENTKQENQSQPMEQAQQQQQELSKQVEELRRQVGELQKEKSEIFAKLQRVAADYDNYQKRSAKQITDSIAYEKDKLIKVLLPVLDDLERVLAHTDNAEAVVKGVSIVYEHLKGVLRAQGVEQIESAGEKFDPACHQALTQRSEQDKEDGVVLEELQKGYKLDGRVIRACRVVVNKTPPSQASQQPEEPETKDTQ
jgi:molecular chaperone GrpE